MREMEYAGIDIAKPDGADARIAPPEISRPAGTGASAGEPPLTSSVKWTMRFPANPRRQFRGVSLRATDCEFQVGHGKRRRQLRTTPYAQRARVRYTRPLTESGY